MEGVSNVEWSCDVASGEWFKAWLFAKHAGTAWPNIQAPWQKPSVFSEFQHFFKIETHFSIKYTKN